MPAPAHGQRRMSPGLQALLSSSEPHDGSTCATNSSGTVQPSPLNRGRAHCRRRDTLQRSLENDEEWPISGRGRSIDCSYCRRAWLPARAKGLPRSTPAAATRTIQASVIGTVKVADFVISGHGSSSRMGTRHDMPSRAPRSERWYCSGVSSPTSELHARLVRAEHERQLSEQLARCAAEGHTSAAPFQAIYTSGPFRSGGMAFSRCRPAFTE